LCVGDEFSGSLESERCWCVGGWICLLIRVSLHAAPHVVDDPSTFLLFFTPWEIKLFGSAVLEHAVRIKNGWKKVKIIEAPNWISCNLILIAGFCALNPRSTSNRFCFHKRFSWIQNIVLNFTNRN
jgi:hypothetical protein